MRRCNEVVLCSDGMISLRVKTVMAPFSSALHGRSGKKVLVAVCVSAAFFALALVLLTEDGDRGTSLIRNTHNPRTIGH